MQTVLEAKGHPLPTEKETRRGSSAAPREADVAIIGAGLSGSLAATVLARAGIRVSLVDVHANQAPDFRVEKIAGDQVILLRRLGLLERFAAASTRVDEIINAAHGRVLDRTLGEHYSILYPEIVKVARDAISSEVEFIVGRVSDLTSTPTRQRVALSNGEVLNPRLVVLATGQGDTLRQKLGIERRVAFPKHSLSFGFTIMRSDGERFPFPALTYYGERLSDGIDYLTFLPLGASMRCNLFTFCDHRDEWARQFRQDPKSTLLGVLPGLRSFLPEFDVVGKAQLFVMDLSMVENHRQAGVVLIGDAFQTSCPAAGTGVSRLLVDVDQLCNVHIPNWLATPGMGAEKISQFYDDPVKRRSDEQALKAAHYRRSLTVDTSLPWKLRRGGPQLAAAANVRLDRQPAPFVLAGRVRTVVNTTGPARPAQSGAVA